MLSPVLADSETGTIEAFDVAAAAKKKSGDMSVEQLGRNAQLPWETDGQRWHTKECLSHDGRRCRWEGEALQFVVDLLAEDDRLDAVNWNHRSTIEVKAKGGLGWLLHARSGHEWLLTLCFRVRKNTFDGKQLAADLNLTPIDDVEEIHYYNQSPRVKVRNLKTPWQEVTIKVWKKSEIDVPAFRNFLSRAVEGHLAQALKEKARPDDLTPWKHLGRKWHLMKKAIAKKPEWSFDTLEKLLPVVEAAWSDCDVDYGIRSKIKWKHASSGYAVAELHTKGKAGLDLAVFVPPDSVTIGAVAEFGVAQEIKRRKDGRDAVRLRFREASQVTAALSRWLKSV